MVLIASVPGHCLYFTFKGVYIIFLIYALNHRLCAQFVLIKIFQFLRLKICYFKFFTEVKLQCIA